MHPSVVRPWPHSELSKRSFQSCDLSLTTIWVMWYWSRGAIGSFNCILEILKVQIGLTKVPLQSAVTWLEQKMIMWLNNDVITLIGIFITRGAITCCENFPKFEIYAEIKTRILVELREFEKFKISSKNLFAQNLATDLARIHSCSLIGRYDCTKVNGTKSRKFTLKSATPRDPIKSSKMFPDQFFGKP